MRNQPAMEIAMSGTSAKLMGIALMAFMLGGGAALAQTPFYQASPREPAAPPGTLIRSEPMESAPAGAQAYRVLYRSTGMHGEPIAVSGVIIVTPGSAPASRRT